MADVMAAKAREILCLEAAIDRSVEAVKRTDQTQLSFSSTRAFAMAYMPQILRSFMLETDAKAQIAHSIGTAPQIVQSIQDGSVDLAVIDHCPSLDLGSLARVPLADVNLAFVCSSGLNIPSGETTLRQLLPHTFIVRSNESCSRGILEKNLAKIGLSVDAFKKVIVVDDLSLTLQILREGGATTFMSRELAAAMRAEHELSFHTVPGLIHSLKRTLLIGARQSDLASCLQLRGIVIASCAQMSAIGTGEPLKRHTDRLRLVKSGTR